jgi:hypothetical protein
MQIKTTRCPHDGDDMQIKTTRCPHDGDALYGSVVSCELHYCSAGHQLISKADENLSNVSRRLLLNLFRKRQSFQEYSVQLSYLSFSFHIHFNFGH